MPEQAPSPQESHRRVGPPVLLGQRSRFTQRVQENALLDERIQALSFWGSIARGEADEWSGVELVASVVDDALDDVVRDLSGTDTLYGQSLVTLKRPGGVAGGCLLTVTYLQSGLPLHVDWYICPASLGVPIHDTKPLFARGGWPLAGPSFAELLRDHPSTEEIVASPAALVASEIPLYVSEVVRGRHEVVSVNGEPAADRIAAYDELARLIAELPAELSDARPALFYHLGIARRGR